LGDEQDDGGYLNSFLKWKELLFTNLGEIFKDSTFGLENKMKSDGLNEAPKFIYNVLIDEEATLKNGKKDFLHQQILDY